MDELIRTKFLHGWQNFFPDASLPLVFFFDTTPRDCKTINKAKEHRCVICDIHRVRKGHSIAFSQESLSCGGAEQYFGFRQERDPSIYKYLSCGEEGKYEGLHYKETPDLVRETFSRQPQMIAPAECIIFKRIDMVQEDEQPGAVIFFNQPDIIAALFALFHFDEADPLAVLTPSCAACSSIVNYPYTEGESGTLRGIMGMFDLSARHCVQPNIITFAVPWERFVRMVENMERSVLTGGPWKKLKNRGGPWIFPAAVPMSRIEPPSGNSLLR